MCMQITQKYWWHWCQDIVRMMEWKLDGGEDSAICAALVKSLPGSLHTTANQNSNSQSFLPSPSVLSRAGCPPSANRRSSLPRAHFCCSANQPVYYFPQHPCLPSQSALSWPSGGVTLINWQFTAGAAGVSLSLVPSSSAPAHCRTSLGL